MTRSKNNNQKKIEALADLFHHLSDPNRLRIMLLLAKKELSVTELTQHLEVTLSAVSHQLKVLRQANLVSRRRVGQSSFYHLSDAHIHQLIAIGKKHVNE
ncbi:metalloregulator ArsR/SmtB family transcription factor [bacterium]|nr:metalloregulator ArsR/SmtB family transcription factor [bacterium]